MVTGFLPGGEGEIRTLETLMGPTRFPVVRARPTTRLLRVWPTVKTICSFGAIRKGGGPSGTRTRDYPVMSRML